MMIISHAVSCHLHVVVAVLHVLHVLHCFVVVYAVALVFLLPDVVPCSSTAAHTIAAAVLLLQTEELLLIKK